MTRSRELIVFKDKRAHKKNRGREAPVPVILPPRKRSWQKLTFGRGTKCHYFHIRQIDACCALLKASANDPRKRQSFLVDLNRFHEVEVRSGTLNFMAGDCVFFGPLLYRVCIAVAPSAERWSAICVEWHPSVNIVLRGSVWSVNAIYSSCQDCFVGKMKCFPHWRNHSTSTFLSIKPHRVYNWCRLTVQTQKIFRYVFLNEIFALLVLIELVNRFCVSHQDPGSKDVRVIFCKLVICWKNVVIHIGGLFLIERQLSQYPANDCVLVGWTSAWAKDTRPV